MFPYEHGHHEDDKHVLVLKIVPHDPQVSLHDPESAHSLQNPPIWQHWVVVGTVAVVEVVVLVVVEVVVVGTVVVVEVVVLVVVEIVVVGTVVVVEVVVVVLVVVVKQLTSEVEYACTSPKAPQV
jgi:hypothetical protein